jgi:hypothetical protein
VPAEYRKRCENVLRSLPAPGFSQAWQDWILYRNFFANTSDDMYVDIGTNHPIHISNTACFDLCLGWKGACFEPQMEYYAGIREKRSCQLVPRCVLGAAQNASFTSHGGYYSASTATAESGARSGSKGTDILRDPATGSDTVSCVGIQDTLQAGLECMSIGAGGLSRLVRMLVACAVKVHADDACTLLMHADG